MAGPDVAAFGNGEMERIEGGGDWPRAHVDVVEQLDRLTYHDIAVEIDHPFDLGRQQPVEDQARVDDGGETFAGAKQGGQFVEELVLRRVVVNERCAELLGYPVENRRA